MAINSLNPKQSVLGQNISNYEFDFNVAAYKILPALNHNDYNSYSARFLLRETTSNQEW